MEGRQRQHSTCERAYKSVTGISLHNMRHIHARTPAAGVCASAGARARMRAQACEYECLCVCVRYTCSAERQSAWISLLDAPPGGCIFHLPLGGWLSTVDWSTILCKHARAQGHPLTTCLASLPPSPQPSHRLGLLALKASCFVERWKCRTCAQQNALRVERHVLGRLGCAW